MDASRAEKLRQEIGFTEHTWPLDKVYEYYGATPTNGLSSAQVLQNREKYGWNRLTPPIVVPWWIKYLKCYADVFMMLLLFGGVLCFVAYGIDQSDPTNLYLGVVLIMVVFISATFGYLTESKADSVMEGFKKLVAEEDQGASGWEYFDHRCGGARARGRGGFRGWGSGACGYSRGGGE